MSTLFCKSYHQTFDDPKKNKQQTKPLTLRGKFNIVCVFGLHVSFIFDSKKPKSSPLLVVSNRVTRIIVDVVVGTTSRFLGGPTLGQLL